MVGAETESRQKKGCHLEEPPLQREVIPLLRLASYMPLHSANRSNRISVLTN